MVKIYYLFFLVCLCACTNDNREQQETSERSKWGKNYTWTYVQDGMDSLAWAHEFDTFKMAGIDAVLLLLRESTTGQFANVVRWGKIAGLEMQVWIPVMNPHGNDSTEIAHPEWYVVSREGLSCLEKQPYIPSYKWLCPSRKEVRTYLKQEIGRLASDNNLDGIHLDYIRIPDVILPVGIQPRYDLVQDREFPEFDFCYCEVCRENFRGESGFDPLSLEDPSTNEAWRLYRYRMINEVVQELTEVVQHANMEITAAVFPTPELAKRLVRQDWTNWNIDAVMPMIYHQYYLEPISWIEKATMQGTMGLNGKFPLYSGLFIREIPADSMAAAVDYAKSGGAKGICLFNSNGMKSEQWMALAKAIHQ